MTDLEAPRRDGARPSPEGLVEVGRRRFGLAGEPRVLPGEADVNLVLAHAGRPVVLKASPPSTPPAEVELQVAALQHLARRAPDLAVPRLVPALDGAELAVETIDGAECRVRATTFLEGRLLADVAPRGDALLADLGGLLGRLDRALADFDPPGARRRLAWDLRHGLAVVASHRGDVAPGRRPLFESLAARVERELGGRVDELPLAVVHNDANDLNVLVLEDLGRQRASGVIDFGDLVHTWRVAEPAIAAAYAAFGRDDVLTATGALAAGYAAAHELEDVELDVLAELAILRLLTSVAISARRARETPDDPYLTVSEAPAWRALERWDEVPAALARAALRATCGREPCPRSAAVRAALDAAEITPLVELDAEPVRLDLGPASVELTRLDEGRPRGAALAIEELLGDRAGLGSWFEARRHHPGVAEDAYGRHLGADLFVPEGTVVRAPLDVEVVSVGESGLLLRAELAGPVRVLLDPVQETSLTPGARVARGEPLGRVAATPGWASHLHVQLLLEDLGDGHTLPRRGDPAQSEAWRALCPDPARLLGLRHTEVDEVTPTEILARRRARVVPCLSLSYDRPLTIVRGFGRHLFDHEGRAYLDAVNNVPHVGHAHPRVVRAGARQMRVLNTNTRYLHPLFVEYVERLAATLPHPLSVVFLVNSGSEANELALRLARTATGASDFLVVDGGYHGNTAGLVDLSPYKNEGPGGAGAPPHVHKVAMPDTYRGPFRADDPLAGERYADDVRRALGEIAAAGRRPAGFLAEPMLGCGGQIVPPPGWLASTYESVRAAEGVCIADEVQVGFGRAGRTFWAFELQDVVPDIVTLGKPIGNGHPLGAVVTTPEIAEAFVTGMEYFNTFGGNPVSCAIGLAVLDVIAEEDLQENARVVGARLLAGLRGLVERHELAGDARGEGLYLGLELVRDRTTLEPAAAEASHVVNRAKELGVLLSTDGPLHNVVKIKPPIVFTAADADRVVETLDRVLGESALRDRAPRERP